LTAAREGFGLLGVVLAAALPAMLAAELSEGIARLAWVLPPLLLIVAATTFAGLAPGSRRMHLPSRCLPSLRRVMGDVAFRRCSASSSPMALPPRCRRHCSCSSSPMFCRLERASGPLLAVYFVAGAASLPLWVRLAAQRPRARLARRRWLLSMLAFAGASQLGPRRPVALCRHLHRFRPGARRRPRLPAAIAADLGERQGQAGACFGVWNFVAKLNLALAAGLACRSSRCSATPGSSGNDGLGALTLAYALLPLGFKALAACCSGAGAFPGDLT
jgi:GPH family glycoside/pentoside/hexuronide:cation symporter